jgi:1-acyl-sn-glycerol-3-phosphate acyltransferase
VIPGGIPAAKWRRPERLYDLLAPLARLVVWLLADLRVIGAERIPAHGGVLLAAHHICFLDPLVLAVALYACGRRKVRFLALADLFDHPLVAGCCGAPGCSRSPAGVESSAWPRTPARPWRPARRCWSIPRARSSRPARPARPRPRAGLVALQARVPVLPIASQGAECRRLPRLRRRVSVVVGPPVDLSRWHGRLDRQAQLEASAALLASVQALRHHPQGR